MAFIKCQYTNDYLLTFKTGLRHLSFCGENSGSYSLLPMRRQGHRQSDLISKKFRSEEKKGDIS